jgi:formyltetrahydrofolate deformylase
LHGQDFPAFRFDFQIPVFPLFLHSMPTTLLMTLDCADRVGLLARITGFVASQKGNFTEVHQYTDSINGWFFARFAFEVPEGTTLESVRCDFSAVAVELNASWNIRDQGRPLRTVLLVSREDHCLADMIWRWRSREMNIAVPLVISNHDTLRSQVEKEGLPFLHIPVPADPAGKEAAFRRISDAICDVSGELSILCRYMQILPDWFCEEHHNRVINIHHSLLPAFAGAGVEKHRNPAESTMTYIGSAIRAATVMATIDRQIGGNTVHPAKRAFRIAIRLGAPGWLAIESAREHAGDAALGWGRWAFVQHGCVKTAMDENPSLLQQPGRGSGQFMAGARPQRRIELRQRCREMGVHADIAPAQCAGQLVVVIAEQKQAPFFIEQLKGQPQRAGTVWPVIHEIAELDDEMLARGRGAEAGEVPVDIAHHADRAIRRDEEAHRLGAIRIWPTSVQPARKPTSQ